MLENDKFVKNDVLDFLQLCHTARIMPNPETLSVVNKDNRTRSQIVTAGDNRLYFEDEEGKERILMHSPVANSFVRLGTHNDPVYEEDQDTSQDGIRISSQGDLNIDSQNASVTISSSLYIGL
jgi:hypothetical protein